jgi:hypothetical protein
MRARRAIASVRGGARGSLASFPPDTTGMEPRLRERNVWPQSCPDHHCVRLLRRHGGLSPALCLCRHGTPTHRVLHTNVTAHPTAPWTLQQLREARPADHRYYFLLHDHDSIFSQRLDQSLRNLGLKVVKTPPQSPQAHGLCERLMSMLRLSAWLLSCPSQQITCDVCYTQECSITTQGARTCCWDQGFHSHARHCQLRYNPTGIDCHYTYGWSLSHCWAGYIISTGLKHRRHDALNNLSVDHRHEGPRESPASAPKLPSSETQHPCPSWGT